MLLGQRVQSKGIPHSGLARAPPGRGGDWGKGSEGGMGTQHRLGVEFARRRRGSSSRRHSGHWGELSPRCGKQEGASNLLNLCIDKLSS